MADADRFDAVRLPSALQTCHRAREHMRLTRGADPRGSRRSNTDELNIWLLPSAFYPHKGGVEELTLQLARHLRERGHRICVLTNRHPAELPAFETIEGIPVRRYAFPSPRAALGPMLRFPPAFGASVASLKASGDSPDVLHVQCASVQLPPAAVFAKLERVPLVLTTQGETQMDSTQIFDRSLYLRTALRLASRSAAALTACSRWAAEMAANLARAFEQAIVIPNGVDPTQWVVTTPPEEPVVAAWGRHVPQKGFDLLLAAWPGVRKLIPSARLLIGGEGPETAQLRALAGDGVTFVGPLDRPGVQRLLDGSRVAAIPSRLEPFGIVALEAMAAGRGVVWSTRGGLGDATGGLGWAVDPADPETLATTLVRALRAPSKVEKYRQRAEEFSWASLADRYLDVYEAALVQHGRRNSDMQ